MLKELVRSCPICGERVGRVLTTIHLAMVDDECLPLQFDVVSCKKCLFCFDDIEASQVDFDKYYAQSVKYTTEGTVSSGGFSEKDIQRYEKIYNRIAQYIAPSSKILEVGAGKCGLLNYLRNKGFMNLFGVEPSGAKHIYSDAIRVFSTLSDVVNSGHKEFDFIISSQTFEHILDIENSLNKLTVVLSKEGKFYVDVPDASFYKDVRLAPYYFFDREHINHFTLQSLNNYFCAYGFKMCSGGKFFEFFNGVYGIFAFTGKKYRFKFDSEAEAIFEYCNISKEKDNLKHLQNLNEPIILWGLGAHLRRIILKDDFPKNISAIIDRDRGGFGHSFLGIPIEEEKILFENQYEYATVIITSVLYADEIKSALSGMNFKGKVLCSF